MVYAEVTWMFVVAIVVALIVAYGVGANDVANAFGPSVGAKALTMKQAILVAAIFEFAGAVLMGAGVVETIRSGITNITYFQDSPDILAFGMLCALTATGTWLIIATALGLPVSSTQSIVSAIAGMAIVAEGFDAVVWSASKDEFPYVKGMAAICLSWVFAPILSGIAAFLLFWAIRTLVLRSGDAYRRSLFLLPLFTFLTFFVVTWFIMAKGGTHYGWEKTPDSKKAWISATTAGIATLLSIAVGIPLIRRKVSRDMAAKELAGKAGSEAGKVSGSEEASVDEEAGMPAAGAGDKEAPAARSGMMGKMDTLRQSRMYKAATYSANYDIHKVVETDPAVAELHANSETFDDKAETSFKYLQIFTACAGIFAHGSNEVANSVGALAAIYQIWQDTAVSSKPTVPTWILAIGGFGMVLGLATFGWRVMQGLGVQMTRLSNSRGFCVEISVAAIVIVASRFGLPMSTTPATVGAIAGVGLWEGRKGLNLRLTAKYVAGWVITIIAVICLSCALMAQGLYSPNKNCSNERSTIAVYLNDTANAIATVLPATEAASIEALTAGQQVPVISLIPPAQTQCTALAFLDNSTAAYCATL